MEKLKLNRQQIDKLESNQKEQIYNLQDKISDLDSKICNLETKISNMDANIDNKIDTMTRESWRKIIEFIWCVVCVLAL